MRVVCVFDDLLLGSNVLGLLRAAGHEATLGPPAPCDVLVADVGSHDPGDLVAASPGARRLGLFSHVRPGQRERALAAGFDLVVPRSRFMREGAALVESLAAP